MAIPVKLNVFEGPLDLLLHLIDKNKIDIYDIPIVEITDQYMEYIHAMEKEDLGIMSEFMVMAATLLDIKCRMLLPKEINEEGEEEDPRAELVQKLLEYKMYKYMSYELKDKMDDASGVYFREPDVPREVLQYREPVDPSELLAGLTLEKLNAIYQSIIRRQDDRRDPIRSQFGKIEKEEVSLSDKMLEMKEFAKTHRKFSFRDLLKKQCSKVQVIVTFLSVLELIKMGHIHVVQEEIFDDIQINVVTEPETWKNLTEFAEEEGECMEIKRLEGAVEAILFAMGESVELGQIAKAIQQDKPTTEKLLHNLMDKYKDEGRGIQIIELEGSYQLCTKRDYYGCLIRIAMQPKKPALTDVMLETLSIIAYKQPVTKAEIEKIRGVKSDHAVNKLVEYNLVKELGRLDAPGRPILFGTTEEFLRTFGVQGLEELPAVDPVKMADFKAEAEEEVQLKLDI